jgi:TPR repeat protein
MKLLFICLFFIFQVGILLSQPLSEIERIKAQGVLTEYCAMLPLYAKNKDAKAREAIFNLFESQNMSVYNDLDLGFKDTDVENYLNQINKFTNPIEISFVEDLTKIVIERHNSATSINTSFAKVVISKKIKGKGVDKIIKNIIIINTDANKIKTIIPDLNLIANDKATAKQLYDKAEEAVNKKDFNKAFVLIKQSVEKGHLEAEVGLGGLYFLGIGTGQDEVKGLKYLKQAAEKGFADVGFYDFLAFLYSWGLCVPQDDTEAVKWYTKAAEKGKIESQSALADMYIRGEGVKKDYQEALKWIKKALEKDDSRAQFLMGLLYRRGWGVSQDYEESQKWFKKSKQNNKKSQADDFPISIAENLIKLMEKCGGAKIQFLLSGLYFTGKEGLIVQDNNKALQYLMKSAEQSYAEAQGTLSVLYLAGALIKKDPNKALEWGIKAATQGNIEAQIGIAKMYLGNMGIEKNYAEAFKWCSEAARQEVAEAQDMLGMMYLNGYGVKQDFKEATKWFDKAKKQGYDSQVSKDRFKYASLAEIQPVAEGGDPFAQAGVGMAYFMGNKNVKKDYKKAKMWLEKAVAQDNEMGQFVLGAMYFKGIGVKKDEVEGVKLITKAAEKGFVEAQNILGEIYLDSKDYKNSIHWHTKAAEQGYAKSQLELGYLYYYVSPSMYAHINIDKGMLPYKDASKALLWFTKAAEQGNAEAQYRLGSSYREYGGFGLGLAENTVLAVEWLRKAAEQGHAQAQYQLGFMYEFGEGVDKDTYKAMEWYGKAAVQGNKIAKDALRILKKRR